MPLSPTIESTVKNDDNFLLTKITNVEEDFNYISRFCLTPTLSSLETHEPSGMVFLIRIAYIRYQIWMEVIIYGGDVQSSIC
ncbi:17332_t:CDS:2 [Dentiscutata heterogama]|uniref:17332_t:CDS:1 n=1 Tax=Dentiscutata heterogama TaxID=1316150 RepID=A0ACA9KB06_9GLOM|nr:17332_t:CDS:2 [Dentiscutata heterogama]